MPDMRTSKLGPLKDKAFLAYYAGTSLSALTGLMLPVAFALEAIDGLGSAAALTAVLICMWAARFVCTPIAGELAARYPSIRIMVCANVAQLIVHLAFAGFLIVNEDNSALAMAIYAAAYGSAAAFTGPAAVKLLPRILPSTQLKPGNTLLSLALDVGSILGPLLATTLTLALGFVSIVVIDAVALAIGAFTLLLCATFLRSSAAAGSPHTESTSGSSGPSSEESTGFLGVLRSTRWLTPGLVLWFCISVSIGATTVAGPGLVVPHHGSENWGLVATSMAAGSLLGTVAALFLRSNWRILASFLAVMMSAQLLSLAILGQTGGWWATGGVMIGYAAGALAVTSVGIVWTTILQTRLDGPSLARFSSTEGFIRAGAIPLGMMLGGLAASSSPALILGLICALLIASLIWLWVTTPAHVDQQDPSIHTNKEPIPQ